MVATSGFDEQYTMDAINRLTQMKRGTLNASHIITGTPGRQQDWTLDPVGNWPDYVTATSGTTDLDQSRTSSTVNEITAIGTNTGGVPVWATPGYDAAGNMTAFLNPSSPTANLTAVYDAWNRLVAVKDGSDFVAQYAYDGLKRRVVKKSYTGGVLQETRDFYFSDQWQVLSEAVSGTTDNAYAWGLRYVDELLWRVDGGSSRQYAMQDANFNCTAICDGAGSVLERYQFDPYGNRTVLNASWTVIGTSAYAWVIGHQSLMLEVDVGLYNCRNRVYLPLLGCWMQRDPLGYADGASLYEYVSSNPVIGTDPSGTGWWCITKCAALIAIAVAALVGCFAAIGSCIASGGAACLLAVNLCCAGFGFVGAALSYCAGCSGSSIPPWLSEFFIDFTIICGVITVALDLRALFRKLLGGSAPIGALDAGSCR